MLTICIMQNLVFYPVRQIVQQFLNASRTGNIDLMKSKFFHYSSSCQLEFDYFMFLIKFVDFLCNALLCSIRFGC